jgi:hypothetical protein
MILLFHLNLNLLSVLIIAVFKRPYCDDFLRFCMHHFELGIWSSRLRANVDAAVDILMEDDVKQRLLFCWVIKCMHMHARRRTRRV